MDMRHGVIRHIDATWTSSGTIMLYSCSVYCLKAVLERFNKWFLVLFKNLMWYVDAEHLHITFLEHVLLGAVLVCFSRHPEIGSK